MASIFDIPSYGTNLFCLVFPYNDLHTPLQIRDVRLYFTIINHWRHPIANMIKLLPPYYQCLVFPPTQSNVLLLKS